MLFPWGEYKELQVEKRNTLQVFATMRCNLKCPGCFARNVMCEKSHAEEDIRESEYQEVVAAAQKKGAMQINMLGGEPLMHPKILDLVAYNLHLGLKTTIYTNGYLLTDHPMFDGVKIRASLYHAHGPLKSLDTLRTDRPVDICFMVSKDTKVEELLEVVNDSRCRILFISSIRELDNPRHEFFDDTEMTMPVLQYKELVHTFLRQYQGFKEIHVSKRGVFESTMNKGSCYCRFANYFPGRRIIQCPYDIVNKVFQNDYAFGVRPCQQNSTCLMSKVVYQRKEMNTYFKEARDSVARWPEWKRKVAEKL